MIKKRFGRVEDLPSPSPDSHHSGWDKGEWTHNSSRAIDSAEFFARASWKVLRGDSPVSAMEKVAARRFQSAPILEWVREGIGSRDMESHSAIARFGQSCHKEEAWDEDRVLEKMYQNSGRHFDPEIIPIFFSCLDVLKSIARRYPDDNGL